MEVALFMRKPRPGQNFSVELLVDSLIQHLGPEIHARKAVSRFESNGIFRRLFNVVEAACRQGDVNHISGDVHFLTYLLRRRRTVLTVLDCGRIAGAPDWRKRVVRALWFTIPVRQSAVITVISEAVKQELLGHVRVSPDKVHVIPVGVPSVYHHVPRAFNADCPVILQIGTAPNKNLARLFEALAGVRCTLHVVGKLSEEHRALLRRHGINYENFVGLTNEQMLQRYAECDIVAFASTFEGFGMPIVEGNLVGRPVITGNVTSMPEVAGDAAAIVDPFDVDAIRAAVLRIVEDPVYREALVQNGFRNAKRFDPRAIARQYESVYRQLATQAAS